MPSWDRIAATDRANYETVAASQTAQILGGVGGAADFISHVLVIPAGTSPGAVTLIDGTVSIAIFAGGADSVGSLTPFVVPLMMRAVTGPWKITTGAAVSVIAIGDFSA